MNEGRFTPAGRNRLAALRGRRVGVVGLGREGVDLVRFLAQMGAHVTVSDYAEPEALAPAVSQLRGIEVELLLGAQRASDLDGCDEVFVSPGVPREVPVVGAAQARGIPISSSTALFFELCPGRVAGITGSSGKTTTTSLVGAMLREAGLDVLVGGNIGMPMLGRLGDIGPQSWCVLELSSFQLSDLQQSPPIAAILNITPNHLDRHPDMDDYIRAKTNIIRHQSPDNLAVVNADDPITAAIPHLSRTALFSLDRTVEGAWFDGAALRLTRFEEPLVGRSDLRLRGLHNVANALAAALIAAEAGCPLPALRSALRSFEPVPHRLEVVDVVDAVTYVNDSIATSPERSIAALRAIEGPIVLIAGGRDKHLPMADWARVIGQRVRAVVLVGEAATLIRGALDAEGLDLPIHTAQRFAECVPLARDAARPGDTVLLSPGGTSFDEFHDYVGRGEAFRAAVAQLAGKTQ